jgi:hypothetical protein
VSDRPPSQIVRQRLDQLGQALRALDHAPVASAPPPANPQRHV